MADTLAGGNSAAMLWLGQSTYQGNNNQNWRNASGTACGKTTAWISQAYLGPFTNITASTFLGVDSSTGLGYFSFTFQARMNESVDTADSAVGIHCGSGVSTTFGWHQQSSNANTTITVSGPSSCTPTAPIDGHKALPFTGYPVACCVLTHTDGSGNKTWYPIKAGSAAANTLASAITAAGVSPIDDPCNDVAVTVTGFA